MTPYAGDERWALLHGDCVEVMRSMPEASVDAIVCDPPYDLTSGKKGGSGSASVNLRSPYGRARIGTGNGSGGFMGKTWDATGIAFDPATWAEALRVLKPGGHLVAFGGTRTYHRLACAIEDAGFEIRDQLQWLYGSGFPKSLDVSKAIDKAAGAERESLGPKQRVDGRICANEASGATKYADQNRAMSGGLMTPAAYSSAPATSEAAAWDGWGTALKPAHEPICLARKPLAERTVAANVLAHGTGALNVDACRVGMSGDDSDRLSEWHAKYGGRDYAHGSVLGINNGEAHRRVSPPHAAGRWPANVCLSHCGPGPNGEPGCEQVGTRRVRAIGGPTAQIKASAGYEGPSFGKDCRPEGYQCVSHRDPDGTEEVEAWNCAPGCAVRMLDEQAGERTSGGKRGGEPMAPRVPGGPFSGGWDHGTTHGDTGGASRFFYCAKASKRERGEGNVHPCVKPLALLSWLCKLITPPGGLILDPFAGSGSTGLAAMAEGFRFLGIEQDESYCLIARARLSAALPLKAAA